jgi:CheY-like chemotaxis protein
MNRKMIRRILESGASGPFVNSFIREADDGKSALAIVCAEAVAGLRFDFILMDFIMVRDSTRNVTYSLWSAMLLAGNAWTGDGASAATGYELYGSDYWSVTVRQLLTL